MSLPVRHTAIAGRRSITGFTDTIDIMRWLVAHFDEVAVAAVLDDEGEIIDASPFTAPDGASLVTAVAWAELLVASDPDVGRIVLFEVGPNVDTRHHTELDWCYLGLVDLFGLEGVELLDWQRSDGESVRSLAYTVLPDEAWADDPPEEREKARLLVGLE